MAPTALLPCLLATCALVAGCNETAGGGDVAVPGEPAAASWFRDVTASAGLAFRHQAGVDGDYFMPEIMGAGVALLDHDGDGDLDLYLVNGEGEVNRLWRREADGTYTDVTGPSGLGDAGHGMGATVGDYDNDGHPDLYVTNYGPDRLYRNDGDGTFTDVTAAVGIANERWACSASFLDYDRDGDLDLFVANYVHYPEPKVCANDAGRPEYCGPLASPPTPDVLYRNDGGRFTDVSATSGIGRAEGRGLGVACEDFDGDGWIDVYVANDGEANHLWMNRGDGTFVESAVMAGAALSGFGSPQASMGVAAGDVDGDGDLDLFMSHLIAETNTLYRNDGRGNFDDVTAAAGLGAPSLQFTGFGTAFLDVDHDGALDLCVVNGRVKWGEPLPGDDPAGPLAGYAEPNQLYMGDGSGRFTEASDRATALCAEVLVSRGLAIGDLDGDGDLDAVVTNSSGPAQVLINEAPKRGHWLIIRALEPHGPRDAYGAVITVSAGGRRFVRTVNPCSSYASSNDPRAHFGLGPAAHYDAIEVRWPDGTVERYEGGDADRTITLTRGTKP